MGARVIHSRAGCVWVLLQSSGATIIWERGLLNTTLKHGDHNASILAREWCRRLQYFWDLHRNSGDAHYVFTKEGIAAYRPLPEFSTALGALGGRALDRAHELARLVPRE